MEGENEISVFHCLFDRIKQVYLADHCIHNRALCKIDNKSNNISSEYSMRATTTKQLMDQSKLFRLTFWGSILSICVGVICMIVFPFTSCSIRSCSWYYSATYECSSNNRAYCCSSYYPSYCGSSNYCWPKPTTACLGWMIAGSTMMAFGGLLAIFVFIMFCNYRGKIKNGTGYLRMPQQTYPPAYQQPIVIYSDQNQANQYPQYQQYVQQPQAYVQQPQQQNVANQINLSENQ